MAVSYGTELAKWVGFALIKRRQQRQDAEVIPGLFRRVRLNGTPTRCRATDTTATAETTEEGTSRRGMDKRDTEEIHGTAAMRDAELYLSHDPGLPTGLPPLEIRYDRTKTSHVPSTPGARVGAGRGADTHVILAGERLSSHHDGFLQVAPVVHWTNVSDDALRPHTVGACSDPKRSWTLSSFSFFEKRNTLATQPRTHPSD